SRRRHTRFSRDWSSDVCSSDLPASYSFGQKFESGKIYRQEKFRTMFGEISNDKILKSSEVIDSTSSQNSNEQKIKILKSSEVIEIGRASCREREYNSDDVIR